MKTLLTFLFIVQAAAIPASIARDVTTENPKCSNTPAPEVVCGDLEFCINVSRFSSQYKIYEVDQASIFNGTPILYRWYVGSILFIEGPDEIACPARNTAGTITVVITDAEGCDTSFTVSTTTQIGSYVCNGSAD